MALESIEFFKFERTSSLAKLLHQARNRHYSTFSFYSPKEFERALQEFENALRQHFVDPQHIEWVDENVMVVFRTAGRPPVVRAGPLVSLPPRLLKTS